MHNAAQRSLFRSHIKKVLKAVAGNNQESARDAYREATSVIDRMAGKGILHKNAASRYKSRLNTRVRALAQAS